MSYYLTLFYPPSRTGKRIGQYFTASQVSAAVVGLVSAGFQLMDGVGGLFGYQWMFLIYGLLAIVLGVTLLWWLPDRPLPPGERRVPTRRFMKWFPASPEALRGEDAAIHYEDLKRVYHTRPWTFKDLGYVLIDWRLWPLTLMYFGVVGVGIGTQLYGTVIISGINPNFTGVQLSLLFAPIWIVSESGPSEVVVMALTPIDGFDRHPVGDTRRRSFPPVAPCFFLGCHVHPNRRPASDDLCSDCKALGPLRWTSHGGLWPRSNCPYLHDLDQRDIPATPW